LDDILDNAPSLDGSTIDAWMGCPFAAKEYELGRQLLPDIVAVGSEIHEAFGDAVLLWCESIGSATYHQVKSAIVDRLLASRPDIQPMVLSAAAPAISSFVSFVMSVRPDNIIGFDGGEQIGKHGQLSCEIDGAIMTSEVDFLYYTGTFPDILSEIDYKSGWTFHDANSVYNSGQFQRHAILVFENFPSVDYLEVKVWNIRTNSRTPRVQFERRYLERYIERVRTAIQNRKHYYDNPPTFPTTERCGMCNVAHKCPEASNPMRDIASDPAGFIANMAAVAARLNKMEEIATAYVDAHGTIVSGDLCFGRDAPRSTRKVPAKLYEKEDEE